MMRRLPLRIAAFGLGLIVPACGKGAPAPDAEVAPVVATAPARVADPRWAEGWQDAVEQARLRDAAIVAYFRTDWCVWCTRTEERVFREAEVAAVLAATVPVLLEVDDDGIGSEVARRYDVDEVPTIVVVGPDGRELGRADGYHPPARLASTLRRAVGGGGSG